MSLKVLFLAAEAVPWVKVGGLADVAGALPQALRRLGHDVRLLLPKYKAIDTEKASRLRQVTSLAVDALGQRVETGLWEGGQGDLPTYLIDSPRHFGRDAIYGEADDLERFFFYSLAALEVPPRLGWRPDIIHCHDWHAGMTAALLQARRRTDPFYSACASAFTIHNLAYQGWFDNPFAGRAGLYPYLPPEGDPLRAKAYNLMALAIYHADVVSTVSPTYAGEILTPEYGEGLDPVLRHRQGRLFGIINGLDYREINPATDPLIPAHYDASRLGLRARNKTALQERAGLPVRPGVPLLGMVGRLAAQKGLDLVAQALEPLLSERDVQFVLLGTGEQRYIDPVAQVVARHPARARLLIGFQPALAQLIYAGCDLFLMPSRYEPCGLGQLIALRYGAIPVVRRTGGLADTIQEGTPDLKEGNGFLFDGYNAGEFLAAIDRALAGLGRKRAWRQLMIRGMQADFSWEASAGRYVDLYRAALGSI